MPMKSPMSELPALIDSSLPRRLVLSDVPPEAFAGLARSILAKLGYQIVGPNEFAEVATERGVDRPDLRIVDERTLANVDEDGGPPIPIIVLTGRHGVTGADPRIVGAIKRPAGLHELYRLMQQVLEDRPRAAPRIPTHFPASASREGRQWTVQVLSLSENGCLIRSSEPLLLGSRVGLRFSLPRAGSLELAAEVGYQLIPDMGLIFHATPAPVRNAISGYVTQALIDA